MRSSNSLLLCFVPPLVLFPSTTSAVSTQSISTKGELKCGSVPAFGVLTRLYDHGGSTDSVIAEGYTDPEGMFSLFGSVADSTPIDPELKVFHDCNDGNKPGQRKFRFRIPDHYVSTGPDPGKVFDVGVINLEMKPYNEERTHRTRRRMRRMRKRRDQGRQQETLVACDSCTIRDEEALPKESSTQRSKSKFRNLDESPEERIDPW